MYDSGMTSARHSAILDRLRTSERVAVRELADALNASEVTIRRDLDELAGAGVLRRVRGGAVSALRRGEEPPFAMRTVESAGAKQRIAAAAAQLLTDGEAVLLDSGTTGLAAARAVAGRRLTVMPLSLHAIHALEGSDTVTLLLAGGAVRPGELSLTGPVAESSIGSFRFDTALLTCCGFSIRTGVTAHDVQDAAVKRAALASSARTVALVDGTKFARTALAVVSAATDVDVVVTDDTAPGDEVERLRSAGIEVVCA